MWGAKLISISLRVIRLGWPVGHSAVLPCVLPTTGTTGGTRTSPEVHLDDLIISHHNA